MHIRRSCALFWLVLAPLACGASVHAKRPTVVLVSIDTLRADHVGTYGYARDTTPFLDRWAKDGSVFERAFTPCAWTLVAHMTMLTGLFPDQHGVVKDDLALAPGIPLVAERLKAAGYQTVGLYHPCWVHERHGFGRGFDVFRGHANAEEAGQHLAEELARLDPARPLFLFVHLYDVHNEVTNDGVELIYPSPEPYQNLFRDGAMADLPALPAEKIWETKGLLSEAQLRTLVAYYDGGIRYVDAKLEQWFGLLKEQGWLEDALVIVTSDHGEALGQRGQLDGHGGFAQEGLHVPLIVHAPQSSRSALQAGTRVNAVVHLGDLVPTILASAGLPADARLPGRSLFGELPHERVITGSYSYPPSGYVLRWPEKILSRGGGRCLAVDLERDPGELHLEKAKRERFNELVEQAYSHAQGFPAAHPADALPPAERDALRALGYGGGDER